MSESSREYLLKMYAGEKQNAPKQDFFVPVLLLMLLLMGVTGWKIRQYVPSPETIQERISQIQTSFIIQEKHVVAPVEKPKVIKKKEEKPPEEPVKKEEPIDLTQKPVLNQKQDEIVKPEQEQVKPTVVRRVYGLKKVYSTGIGASGGAGDAVIGKVGNTLNTEIDTLTATQEELKGALVSVTTVTSMPKPKKIVKPEYTKEMLDNKVEGVVRVKVLIDIDGKVKKAIVLDDLGHGAKEKAFEACLKLEFEPALVNDEPRATWIIISFRFAILQ